MSIGVDLSHSPAVAVAVVQQGKSLPVIVAAQHVDSEAMPTNPSGLESWMNALVDLIEQFKAKKIVPNKVSISFPADLMYRDQVSLINDAEDLLQWQVEEHLKKALNREVAELFYDFNVSKQTNDDERINIAIAAMRSEQIEPIVQACQQKKIPLLAIELESGAMVEGAVALAQCKVNECDALLYIDKTIVRLVRYSGSHIGSDVTTAILGAQWIDAVRRAIEQLWGQATKDAKPHLVLCGPCTHDAQLIEAVTQTTGRSLRIASDSGPHQVDENLHGKVCGAYGLTLKAAW